MRLCYRNTDAAAELLLPESWRVRLDDGQWVEVRESDRLFGSAEAVENRW